MVTKKTRISSFIGFGGEIIGVGLILLWAVSTFILISQPALPNRWLIPIFVALQTHLYTGMFITAHDAMHGLVSRNKKVNDFIGTVAALLFAFNRYSKLLPKHHAHHRHVGSEDDPDFHEGGFWKWYYGFAREYISPIQILYMAIAFNVLKYFFRTDGVILFWIVPSILSTLQLFYFGTYLPHRRNPDFPANEHRARSQRPGHLWAFLSCYFFGYHYEHHACPHVPWWQLWKV